MTALSRLCEVKITHLVLTGKIQVRGSLHSGIKRLIE